MQKVLIIMGPTASGKSDIAVALAYKFNGEIISADSRQVYKGLNIGTGKITQKEMRGIKHYLLDVASPKNRFTVSDFVRLADKAIVEISNKGKLPIICGGTGFYIDALLGEKQIPEVPPNSKLREKLENKPAEELFTILKRLDPQRAETIDAKNPRRLVRAIEICKALGKVPKYEMRSARYKAYKIGIKIPDEELKKRINKRIEKWFKQGLMKEVKTLHKKGLSWKRMREIGLEYKLVAKYYTIPKKPRGTLDTSTLKENMRVETWRYAKRQITWFKKDKNIFWIQPKISAILAQVKKKGL